MIDLKRFRHNLDFQFILDAAPGNEFHWALDLRDMVDDLERSFWASKAEALQRAGALPASRLIASTGLGRIVQDAHENRPAA